MTKLAERLNARVLAVVLALILAAIATLALRDYVQGESNEAAGNRELVTVYQATINIAAGTEMAFANSRGAFVEAQIPRDTITADFVTPESFSEALALIVVQPILKDQFLQLSQLATTLPQTEAFELDDGMVAVSVDIGRTAGVANFVDPGDRVTIVTHIAGAASDPDNPNAGPASEGATSRILLQNVEILAIGTRLTAGEQPGQRQISRSDEQLVVTFAVSPADAERLVFASIESTLYLLLQPQDIDEFNPTVTTGRNADNLFGR